ncbi:hypothetical protein A2797_00855 [candidate division WWE3 bacterium RIFCSPHIGHO2_01_FULL_48_15]|uniref:Uncharacterized protein n=1 Tax=candidate division WWE3 bacterium RIFCSPHIGHO2_01_FULL_48_15 TaxID=1802619 RepID=A0A1F4VEH0_UNCKA|nr:MAG: hypothetical protein A2797_00855 [candidate division WWE3 bacterium RIFCSPHIGHO2_01_FULL_48_15]
MGYVYALIASIILVVATTIASGLVLMGWNAVAKESLQVVDLGTGVSLAGAFVLFAVPFALIVAYDWGFDDGKKKGSRG